MPNIKSLTSLCKAHHLSDNASLESICDNELIQNSIHKSLIQTGFAQKLHRIEIPTMIHLCHEEWTPDSGLLTAAMKLKRNAIMQKYKSVVESMFDRLKRNPYNIKCESI
jgi:long-subunit acyl-CoA synthetase (AMP-forming)